MVMATFSYLVLGFVVAQTPGETSSANGEPFAVASWSEPLNDEFSRQRVLYQHLRKALGGTVGADWSEVPPPEFPQEKHNAERARRSGVLLVSSTGPERKIPVREFRLPFPRPHSAPTDARLVASLPHRAVWISFSEGRGLQEALDELGNFYKRAGHKVVSKLDSAATTGVLTVRFRGQRSVNQSGLLPGDSRFPIMSRRPDRTLSINLVAQDGVIFHSELANLSDLKLRRVAKDFRSQTTDWSCSFYPTRLPQDLRTQFVDWMRRHAAPGLQRRDQESEIVHQARTGVSRLALEAVETILTRIDSIRCDVDGVLGTSATPVEYNLEIEGDSRALITLLGQPAVRQQRLAQLRKDFSSYLYFNGRLPAILTAQDAPPKTSFAKALTSWLQQDHAEAIAGFRHGDTVDFSAIANSDPASETYLAKALGISGQLIYTREESDGNPSRAIACRCLGSGLMFA
jgi:hypothetical protein